MRYINRNLKVHKQDIWRWSSCKFFLPLVTAASSDTVDELLQVVQDHPLLKYADPAGRICKATAVASEKFLGPELSIHVVIAISTTLQLSGILFKSAIVPVGASRVT